MAIEAKKFDPEYTLLEEMYNDGYFPDFLIDKVKALIEDVISFFEQGDYTLPQAQRKLDEMTVGINDLQEEFNENNSEIETIARESIGATVEYVLEWFGVSIDIETAIKEREW